MSGFHVWSITHVCHCKNYLSIKGIIQNTMKEECKSVKDELTGKGKYSTGLVITLLKCLLYTHFKGSLQSFWCPHKKEAYNDHFFHSLNKDPRIRHMFDVKQQTNEFWNAIKWYGVTWSILEHWQHIRPSTDLSHTLNYKHYVELKIFSQMYLSQNWP